MAGQSNNILILKGEWKNESWKGRMDSPSLKPKQTISSGDLRKLAADLEGILKTWNKEILPDSIVLTADYCDVIAKSNRIQSLLKPRGQSDLSDCIKGVRFEGLGEKKHHVITYLLPWETVTAAKEKLLKAAECIDHLFQGTVSGDQFRVLKRHQLSRFGISLTGLGSTLKDAWYVTGFRIAKASEGMTGKSLVSLYQIGSKTELIDILRRLDINVSEGDFLNTDTLILKAPDRGRLAQKAGWLIAMEVRDLMMLDYRDSTSEVIPGTIHLPKPTNEPIIGVIDTRFDKTSFYADWVEYHDLVPQTIEPLLKDFAHGTSVSSLIVDGPGINPGYDDGCGLFRVRHFGILSHGPASTFDLLRNIQKIVKENRDIKVWNLSLGSILPINENFVSPEGAELDRLQKEYDVLFIVAGTNDNSVGPNGQLTSQFIGAPADSVNSIVVGACDRSGYPAPYTRRGPVLNFFIKPDLAAFGGTQKDQLFTCTPTGRWPVSGTSYASPWVARKAAFLIHKLQFSRNEAKALLIDSAVGWKEQRNDWPWIGHGILPHRIDEIIRVPEDEIRFIISGCVLNYETFSYDIPIPKNKLGKYDYSVRATLCYSPECRRDQGVDYALTELDLHFGRTLYKKGNVSIRDIGNNLQKDKLNQYLPEKIVRSKYRKWDNVKVKTHFCNKTYGAKSDGETWGVKIYTTERLKKKYGRGLPFTLVVTLKAKDGSDRTTAFIKACQAKGWIVNPVNVQARLQVAAQIEEEIDLFD